MAFGRRDEREGVPPGEAGRPGARDDEVTVIGPGAHLEGLLVSGGSLRIEGEVKGEIRADGDVVVAEAARVEADLRAQNARIDGEFTGNMEVAGRVQLGGSARVRGNVACRALAVVEGALFNGQTSMETLEAASVIPLPEAGPAERP